MRSIFYYKEYGVFLLYEKNIEEKEWESIEKVKKLYVGRLKELIRICLYELAGMEFQEKEDRRTYSTMGNIFFDDKYGVFLMDEGKDEWGAANAHKQYEEKLKKLIKKCMYENRNEDAEAYKRAMETFCEWDKLLKQSDSENKD